MSELQRGGTLRRLGKVEEGARRNAGQYALPRAETYPGFFSLRSLENLSGIKR